MKEEFTPTWLMIKQHSQTGLKYFCKTTKPNPYQYNGSGKYWKRHLASHGKDVSTIWCQLFTDKEELINYALTFSKENNIVESKEWANLRVENGFDGTPVGHRASNETRMKMSIAYKGTGMVGKTHSEETKKKMSIAHSNPSEETRSKISKAVSLAKKGRPNGHLGRKRSAETIAKQSAARKKYWDSRKNSEKKNEDN